MNHYLLLLKPGITNVRSGIVDVRINDKVEMKKQHPCGNKIFTVTRIGMDFKIRCDKCGHEVMIPRGKAEKNIRKIIRE